MRGEWGWLIDTSTDRSLSGLGMRSSMKVTAGQSDLSAMSVFVGRAQQLIDLERAVQSHKVLMRLSAAALLCTTLVLTFWATGCESSVESDVPSSEDKLDSVREQQNPLDGDGKAKNDPRTVGSDELASFDWSILGVRLGDTKRKVQELFPNAESSSEVVDFMKVPLDASLDESLLCSFEKGGLFRSSTIERIVYSSSLSNYSSDDVLSSLLTMSADAKWYIEEQYGGYQAFGALEKGQGSRVRWVAVTKSPKTTAILTISIKSRFDYAWISIVLSRDKPEFSKDQKAHGRDGALTDEVRSTIALFKRGPSRKE